MTDDTDNDSQGTNNQARDERLLAELERAKRVDDNGLRAGLVAAELLKPYWKYSLRIARWRLHDLGVGEQDVEDVAANVFERLTRALNAKPRFSKPLKYVALDNVDWACSDFRRQHKRRGAETLHSPGELPPASSPLGRKRSSASGRRETIAAVDDDGPDSHGLAAQARAFGERIEALQGRDREIISQRFFAAMSPTEIAEQLGVERGAIDTATHRALRKLLASDQLTDVRNGRSRPEGEAA
jgi:RNA polymerase sigma factor (sigma-70 family)